MGGLGWAVDGLFGGLVDSKVGPAVAQMCIGSSPCLLNATMSPLAPAALPSAGSSRRPSWRLRSRGRGWTWTNRWFAPAAQVRRSTRLSCTAFSGGVRWRQAIRACSAQCHLPGT